MQLCYDIAEMMAFSCQCFVAHVYSHQEICVLNKFSGNLPGRLARVSLCNVSFYAYVAAYWRCTPSFPLYTVMFSTVKKEHCPTSGYLLLVCRKLIAVLCTFCICCLMLFECVHKYACAEQWLTASDFCAVCTHPCSTLVQTMAF